MEKKLLVLLVVFMTYIVSANDSKSIYPIKKFKSKTVKLWSYPDYDNSIRVDVEKLGKPQSIKFIEFAGNSNEHLVIEYRGKKYSFSKSKVVLDADFDKRTSSARNCSITNLGKSENRAETTSICEKK